MADTIVHVRLSGPRPALGAMVERLRAVFGVANESADYANRRDPGVRRYLDIEIDESKVARHWRAGVRLTFHDDDDRAASGTNEVYGAWIGAGSEEDARELLADRIAKVEDLASWELTELVEATVGEPELIALWEGDGAP